MINNLLLEYIPFAPSVDAINESIKKNGKILIQGTVQRANAPNQNGRVYPRPILEREIKKYIESFVPKRALGELDHPDSSVVNLANVSHNIVEMHWNNNDVKATIEVLNTPAGRILQELLKAGIEVGISSRGLGSVQENSEGYNEVQEDFELVAFDMVSNPSTHQAFMYPVTEGVDKYGQACVNKYCRIQEIVTDILLNLGEKV